MSFLQGICCDIRQEKHIVGVHVKAPQFHPRLNIISGKIQIVVEKCLIGQIEIWGEVEICGCYKIGAFRVQSSSCRKLVQVLGA